MVSFRQASVFLTLPKNLPKLRPQAQRRNFVVVASRERKVCHMIL
jgi:hypothetical protein